MVMLTSFASFSMVPSDCEWREGGPREEPASQLDGGAVLPLPQNQVAAVEGAAIEVAKAECRPFVAFRGRKPLHLLEAVLDPVAGPLRRAGQAFGHQPAHVVAVRRPRPALAGEVRTPAKQFAEHTDAILRAIGRSEEEILQLKIDGACT